MYWIGVDHHKRNSYVTSLTEDGTVYCRHNLPADAPTLAAFFGTHPQPFTVGIEATYAWEYVADLVEDVGATVRVAHPLLLKAFAKRHKKNDKIDSMLIARLLHQGHLPMIVHPPKAARQRRDLYRQRMELVNRRTGAACRAKALADRLGFQVSMNLSTRKGIAALAELPVHAEHRDVLASHVRMLSFLYEEIGILQKRINRVAEVTPDTQRLMTIPGIGPYLALLIASEVFDITRFPTARHLASYAGVTPGVSCSGGKSFGGHRHPACNKYLRWAFTEAVLHYVGANAWAMRKYERLRRAKGWKTARVAIARHIAGTVYAVWREGRAYDATRSGPDKPGRGKGLS